MKPQYPGPRDLSESQRLKAQSDLVTAAFGSLVLCPLDLSTPGLRILDSGTADGLFLTQIRSLLTHPNSAMLIGTDIAPFEDNVHMPDYIEWHKQDVNTEWPDEWQGTFDLVHQRAVLSNTGGYDGAVVATTRLAKLVRQGGWIQLVDSNMPNEEYADGDPPHLRMCKTIGQFLAKYGLNTDASRKLGDLLNATGEVVDIQQKETSMRVGMNAGSEETRQAGRIWLSGMRMAIGTGLAKLGNAAPMTEIDWHNLIDEVQHEAESTGFELTWWAAWGKRKALS